MLCIYVQLGLSHQRKNSLKVRYDILTADIMKISVLWDVKPYSLVGRLLQYFLPDNMASHPKCRCLLRRTSELYRLSGSQSLSDRCPVNSFFYKMRAQYN
jgi:hypothetical protein